MHRSAFFTVPLIFFVSLLAPASVFALVPSDTFYSHQWYLEKIGGPAAWDVTVGNPASVVAVIDVGVDLDHPDLQDALWVNPGETPGNGLDDDRNGFVDDVHGWDFVSNDPDPSPSYDVPNSDPRDLHHGTVVAGIIAARGNNGEGVAGIDWLAKIMSLRVLRSDGSGDVETVLPAIRYAVQEGATIINLSFVGDERSTDLDQAIADAERAGVLVVAAGGNEDRRGQGDLTRFPVYPICSGLDGRSVLGVAATNQQDQKATFSSYGRCVDLSSPGERIVGTLFHDPNHVIIRVGGTITTATFAQLYGGFFSGTSFAAPIAAGVASLVRGIIPTATPQEVIGLLQATADPLQGNGQVTTDQLGAGRINAARALTEAQATSSTVPNAAASRIAPSAALASIGDAITVRIEIKSMSGIAIVGRELTIRSSRASDSVEPARVTTNGQGVATATIRATEEGIAEIVATIDTTTIGPARVVFARATTAPIGTGSLLRGSTTTVYTIGSDGKRYAFPDSQTFRSWYADDNGVQRVSDVVLAAFPLGGLVTIRPGTFLVKIQTDPKTYAVEPPTPGSGQAGGTLRWVPSEEAAQAIYGTAWAKRVVDVPDAFFTTYRVGAPITGSEPPAGTILEDGRDGERYLITGGQRRLVSSTLVFLKNGFQWRDVVKVPTATYPDGPPIVEREPTLAQFVP